MSVQQNALDYSPMAANLFITQGLILCERHELDAAEQWVRKGLELARERNYIWSIAWGYRALLRLLLAWNNLSAAEIAIREIDQLEMQHEIPEYHTCGLSGFTAKIWIHMGKIERAQTYLQGRNILIDSYIQYPHESEFWSLASVCLAKGDMESGRKLLERLLLRAEASDQHLWSLRFLVLQALLFQALGDREQSLAYLDRAINLAAPKDYIQTFLDEGEPMLHLLEEARRQNIHSGFIRLLLQAFKVETPGGKFSQYQSIQPEKSLLIEPLNKRELEVVQLIAEGFTNKEIAQKLYI